jgi:hypothetical protein
MRRGGPSTRRRSAATRLVPAMPAMPAVLVLVLSLALAGCDGPGVVSPGVVRYGQVGGSGNLAQALVGTWRRTIFFIDDQGVARSSETSWQFGADGAVVRVQVARNLSLGLADVVVSAGRYRVENTRVLIDVVSPSATQLAFEVRVTGAQLTLAGEPYLRVDA